MTKTLITMLVIACFNVVLGSSRFETDGEIIIDTRTCMEWRVGPDENMTKYEAQNWVRSLGGEWRMPYRSELEALDLFITRMGPFAGRGGLGQTNERGRPAGPYLVWSAEGGICWDFYLKNGLISDSDGANASSGRRAMAVRYQ